MANKLGQTLRHRDAAVRAESWVPAGAAQTRKYGEVSKQRPLLTWQVEQGDLSVLAPGLRRRAGTDANTMVAMTRGFRRDAAADVVPCRPWRASGETDHRTTVVGSWLRTRTERHSGRRKASQEGGDGGATHHGSRSWFLIPDEGSSWRLQGLSSRKEQTTCTEP